MNPGPFNPTPPREISVVEPVGTALERVKHVLFRPFDIKKWFIIGFTAWLATLGEGGGGGGNFNPGGGDIQSVFGDARNFVMQNLGWIVPVAAAALVLLIAIWLAILWVSSRGRFMILHCVAMDKAEVVVPWREYSRQGNSLFLFRLCFTIISGLLILPLIVFGAIVIIGMVNAGAATAPGVLLSIGLALLMLFMFILSGIIGSLATDFVVPIMYLRRNRCLESWRVLWVLLKTNFWQFVLFFLFKIVLGIVISTLVLVVILVTCCMAGCLMAIPYLGAVVLLPITMFKRCYSLYFLAQFGREYDVFPPPPPPALPQKGM